MFDKEKRENSFTNAAFIAGINGAPVCHKNYKNTADGRVNHRGNAAGMAQKYPKLTKEKGQSVARDEHIATIETDKIDVQVLAFNNRLLSS